MERSCSIPEPKCTLLKNENNNCEVNNLLTSIHANVELMQITGRIIETISSVLLTNLLDKCDGKGESLSDHQKECLLQNLKLLAINLDDKGCEASEKLKIN